MAKTKKPTKPDPTTLHEEIFALLKSCEGCVAIHEFVWELFMRDRFSIPVPIFPLEEDPEIDHLISMAIYKSGESEDVDLGFDSFVRYEDEEDGVIEPLFILGPGEQERASAIWVNKKLAEYWSRWRNGDDAELLHSEVTRLDLMLCEYVSWLDEALRTHTFAVLKDGRDRRGARKNAADEKKRIAAESHDKYRRRFEELRADGKKKEEAKQVIMKEFNVSERTLDSILPKVGAKPKK